MNNDAIGVKDWLHTKSRIYWPIFHSPAIFLISWRQLDVGIGFHEKPTQYDGMFDYKLRVVTAATYILLSNDFALYLDGCLIQLDSSYNNCVWPDVPP